MNLKMAHWAPVKEPPLYNKASDRKKYEMNRVIRFGGHGQLKDDAQALGT